MNGCGARIRHSSANLGWRMSQALFPYFMLPSLYIPGSSRHHSPLFLNLDAVLAVGLSMIPKNIIAIEKYFFRFALSYCSVAGLLFSFATTYL